jgi:site-specific recombinase XerD
VTTVDTMATRTVQHRELFADFSHLLQRPRIPASNALTVDEVVALPATLSTWRPGLKQNHGTLRGLRLLLGWLEHHPGEGWQQRWVNSGADRDMAWVARLAAGDPRHPRLARGEIVRGLAQLLLAQVVLPSYDFLAAYRANGLFDRIREISRPDLFAAIDQAARDAGIPTQHHLDGLRVLSKIVLHTGRHLGDLTSDDVLEVFAWAKQHHRPARPVPGLHTAWQLASAVGITPAGSTLRGVVLHGQRSTADLVDDYGLQCRPVRDVLVRYLDERRPAMDYNSFRDLVMVLGSLFWADLEKHHPGIDSLRIPEDVAEAWRNRLRTVVAPDGATRPRVDMLRIAAPVRALYLDIQQWAIDDPSWVCWVAPSPIRKRHTRLFARDNPAIRARVHQRIRERLPHLPLLCDTADRLRTESAALLTEARRHEPGDAFEHGGRRYQRVLHRTEGLADRRNSVLPVRVRDLATHETMNIEQVEEDMFWAWAAIEVMRHTGVRIEEMLELTHLAIVSYRVTETAELVPLLQIVPSKSNEERLLLVSPELASVLATIVSRLRARHDGTVPLVSRYDIYERVTGPPLPHLFQRQRGGRPHVISDSRIRAFINRVLAATGLRDHAGRPLTYTPHDFRRMFATDAVATGSPVHIVASLLGHSSLDTTQGYVAVFQADLVRTYRAHLAQRRATRPSQEYRAPTDLEWTEFDQHFQTRKLELGTCGRPYASPCQHEHVPLTEIVGDVFGASRGQRIVT